MPPRPLFIAAGQDGVRLASADGATWGDRQTGREGETYRAAAAGNGLLVAVGSYGGDNVLAATGDGRTWRTGKHEAKYVQYLRGLAFGNGTFLGLGGDPGTVGNAKPFVMLSKDGLAWDGPHDAPGRNILRRAAWGAGRFVSVGDRGRRAASADGRTWADAPEARPIDTLADVTFGNGVFVGVGLHGLRMTTADGVTWSEPVRGDEGEHLNSVVFASDKFVAIGATVTYTSADGRRWERHAAENGPQAAAFGNGVFVGSSWRGRLFRSDDGVKWRETYKSDQHVGAVAFGTVG